MEKLKTLQTQYQDRLATEHLKNLLDNQKRSQDLLIETEHFLLDLTREKIDSEILEVFQSLHESKILGKAAQMLSGERINSTENREVLHCLLRDNFKEPLSPVLHSHSEIYECNQRVKQFTEDVRNGKINAFGSKFENVISIGIGGSYLGVECVYEALKMHPKYANQENNLKLFFLSNVDPACYWQLMSSLDLKKTLILVISKSFTTAETLQNFLLCVEGYKQAYKNEKDRPLDQVIKSHFCAISANVAKCKESGIAEDRIFPMWDWVGGRFSVSSAVGGIPLSLALSFEVFEEFLHGMHWVDKIFFKETDIRKNIPALLALLDYYHNHVERYTIKAIIPYSHGLQRLPAHIQQVEMESNGKRYNLASKTNSKEDVGKFVFGEPGTNSQHSFFQLLHQGRVSPVEFIGFCNPQVPRVVVNDQDCFNEFMANIFAQADALALGRETTDLPKFFEGNRPSFVLLFKEELNAFNTGLILSLYEHRIAAEGFLEDINSFDQFGVELGKKLASEYRALLATDNNRSVSQSDNPAKHLIAFYNKSARFDTH